jgi:hypothetical protein
VCGFNWGGIEQCLLSGRAEEQRKQGRTAERAARRLPMPVARTAFTHLLPPVTMQVLPVIMLAAGRQGVRQEGGRGEGRLGCNRSALLVVSTAAR